MRLADFLKDRGMLLLFHLVCMCVAVCFLRLTNYSGTNTFLVITAWFLVLVIWLAVTYLQRRRFFLEAEKILARVDQRYLLGELLPDSLRLEDRLYGEMLRRSNKSCIERIRRIEDEKRDYKEYIESWVHEIKAPITGIELLCNNRGESLTAGEALRDGTERGARSNSREDYLTIRLENQRIENYVDMVLYYARAEEVYKDYLIQETRLEDVVCGVVEKNRFLLIRNGIQVEVDCADTVYTDRKWIAFILNQMLLNSVKYRSESPVFHVRTRREKNGVLLSFEDNGIGIRGEELSRIFEKGFTGSNGRDRERSTGMGLYLCHKLCDRLGIGLYAESACDTGTKLYLEFPISNYHCEIQKELSE